MTLQEAIKKRIRFVRRNEWKNEDDRLELPLVGEDSFGPWATLHSPAMARIAEDHSMSDSERERFRSMAAQQVFLLGLDRQQDGWVPYEAKGDGA